MSSRNGVGMAAFPPSGCCSRPDVGALQGRGCQFSLADQGRAWAASPPPPGIYFDTSWAPLIFNLRQESPPPKRVLVTSVDALTIIAFSFSLSLVILSSSTLQIHLLTPRSGSEQ